MRQFLLAYIVIGVALGGSCVEGNRIEESPLATWDPSESGIFFTSGRNGTLDITSGCVRLTRKDEAGIESTLLVWPEPTSWNASSQLIEFVGVFGEHLELRDGYTITVAGVGLPLAEFDEEDISTRDYLSEPSYVLPPDPSCKAIADQLFVLNSASLNSIIVVED